MYIGKVSSFCSIIDTRHVTERSLSWSHYLESCL